MTERLPVELSKASRLLNHGPTVLVGSAHDARRNGHWQVEPGAARSLHYIAGGNVFETGEAFEVKS